MTLFTLNHSVVYFMFDRYSLCMCVNCKRMLTMRNKSRKVASRKVAFWWCRNLRQNPHYYIPARVYI